MYSFYESPTTLEEVLALKEQYGEKARIIAGGTDLLIELDRGGHRTSDGQTIGLIDLTRVADLANIWEADGEIYLGPLVTHNQCVSSPLIVEKAFPLARACWEVGAPQIRNRATIAGNLITASPANDSIVPLMALDATVTVQSATRGKRVLPLREFIQGFRQVDLASDEVLTQISFPAMAERQRGAYIKLGLRRAQAISVISVAAIIDLDLLTTLPIHAKWTGGDAPTVDAVRISLGAVAPVVVRSTQAEEYLKGKAISDEVIEEASALALTSTSPIDDIRGSAAYRRGMVETLVKRVLVQLRAGQERHGWQNEPITLWGETDGKWPIAGNNPSQDVQATVNGASASLAPSMSLLDSLREAGFVGVKEGCAEGECGACTIFLDGMAVMACMVPSERAKGSQIITVEGLGHSEQLHPVQSALIQSGGVQCGYCTPGFVMSAAKLLEERPNPTREEAQEALTGNLCRCTGYRKILDAVVMAGCKDDKMSV